MNSHDHEPLTAEERELARQIRRLGPRGEPSAALDARILSAAHAELSEHPPTTATRRRPRWLPTLGLAASLVMAVGIVWQMRPAPPDTTESPPSFAPMQSPPLPAAVVAVEARQEEKTSSATSADGVAAVAAATHESVPAPSTARSRTTDEPLQQPRLQETPAYEPPTPAPASPPSPPLEISATAAPAPPPAPAAPAAMANSVTDSTATGDKAATSLMQGPAIEQRPHAYEARSMQKMAKPVRAPAPAPAPTVTGTRKSLDAYADIATESSDSVAMGMPAEKEQVTAEDARLPRQEWLQRIRERRQAGDEDGARTSLERFVQAHPHSDIPHDLRSLLQDH